MITVTVTHWTGIRSSYEFNSLPEALSYAWSFYKRMALLQSIGDGIDAACSLDG